MSALYSQNTQTRKKIQKVLIITMSWVLIQAVTFINDYYFTMDLIHLKKLTGTYEFWPDFIGNIVLGIIAGLVGGYVLVFKMHNRYSQKSFAYGVISSGLLFVFFYLVAAICSLFLMGFIYFLFQMDLGSAFSRAINNLMINLDSPSFFVTMIIWGLLVSATQFMLQVNDKFGQGVLWKFLTGRYYRPREEERIFMFLDLKSSTTIAERLGHIKYSRFIQDCFIDLAVVEKNEAEVYQYVGDEAVLSWSITNGLVNNNCIMAYFNFARHLQSKQAYYNANYGIVPEFKAGVNGGKVTVAEVGIIKKEIAFHGDTLNTASRIQDQCSEWNRSLLISEYLEEKLNWTQNLTRQPMGNIKLRGKEKNIRIYSVEGCEAPKTELQKAE